MSQVLKIQNWFFTSAQGRVQGIYSEDRKSEEIKGGEKGGDRHEDGGE